MSEQDFVGPSEHQFRRADFVGGIPIKLIDGQEWHFAEPRCRLVPSDSDAGLEVILSLDDDGTFDNTLRDYQAMLFLPKEEFDPLRLQFAALELKLARMMLERNYNLTLQKLQSILQFSHNAEKDPVANAIRLEITRMVSGDGPKPLAGGDDVSLTPSAD